ncbi:MAG: hypothetical protein ACI3Y6_01010, partial [Candidatus Cryptobacteroides sp.]
NSSREQIAVLRPTTAFYSRDGANLMSSDNFQKNSIIDYQRVTILLLARWFARSQSKSKRNSLWAELRSFL